MFFLQQRMKRLRNDWEARRCVLQESFQRSCCPIASFPALLSVYCLSLPPLLSWAVSPFAPSRRTHQDRILCTLCGKGDGDDLLMLCDGCDRGYHTYCLAPPLSAVPEGQWFCTGCKPTRQTSTQTDLSALEGVCVCVCVRCVRVCVCVVCARIQFSVFHLHVAHTCFLRIACIRHSQNVCVNRVLRNSAGYAAADSDSAPEEPLTSEDIRKLKSHIRFLQSALQGKERAREQLERRVETLEAAVQASLEPPKPRPSEKDTALEACVQQFAEERAALQAQLQAQRMQIDAERRRADAAQAQAAKEKEEEAKKREEAELLAASAKKTVSVREGILERALLDHGVQLASLQGQLRELATVRVPDLVFFYSPL